MVESSFHVFRAVNPPGKPAHGVHTCSTCFKTFRRSEHCARHELSHKKERPFACQFCGNAYARKDLVKRHERTMHADAYSRLLEVKNNQSASTNGDDVEKQPSPAPRNEQPSTLRSVTAELPRASSNSRKRTLEEVDEDTDSSAIGPPVSRLSVSTSITAVDDNPNNSLGAISCADDGLSTRRPSVQATNVSKHRVEVPEMPDASAHADPVPRMVTRGTLSPVREGYVASVNNICSPGLDPLIFMRSLDFVSNDLDIAGGEYHGEPGSRMPQDDVNLLPWRHTSFPSLGLHTLVPEQQEPQQTQQGFRSIDTSLPTPESVWQPDAGVKSANKSAGWLPKVLQETSAIPPRVVIDDNAYNRLHLGTCLQLGQLNVASFPKDHLEVQFMINSYIDGFHRHFPIIHLASIKPSQAPTPLIWAMCCIGSLYRLDREKARRFHALSVSMLPRKPNHCWISGSPQSQERKNGAEPRESGMGLGQSEMEPLWIMQTRVLLCYYASLGGDYDIAVGVFDELGLFTRDYRLRRDYLRRSRLPRHYNWEEWIERESMKRLLCSIFMMSNLLVILYDMVPGFDTSKDLDIEELEEERLWNAPTAAAWENLLKTVIPCNKSIRDIITDMLSEPLDEDGTAELYSVSGFTALVAMHAVNVHNWHLSQVSRTMRRGTKTARFTPNIMLQHSLEALTRCHEVLRLSRPNGAEPMWDSPEGPLLFNCEAMLRAAFARLLTDSSLPQRFSILCASSEDRQAALTEFVAAKQERSDLMTEAVVHILESFLVPINAGSLLVQKTAAFFWSIETAVSSWGCAIVLCKWIYSMETLTARDGTTELESRIIYRVKTALSDMECEYEEGRSLAAALGRAWASFNNDVWVWGITSRMAQNLIELAECFELGHEAYCRDRRAGRGIKT